MYIARINFQSLNKTKQKTKQKTKLLIIQQKSFRRQSLLLK